jgi:hypothetical protein
MHRVRAGETPQQIAERHRISPIALVLANSHKKWVSFGAGGQGLTFEDLVEGEGLWIGDAFVPDFSRPEPSSLGAPNVPAPVATANTGTGAILTVNPGALQLITQSSVGVDALQILAVAQGLDLNDYPDGLPFVESTLLGQAGPAPSFGFNTSTLGPLVNSAAPDLNALPGSSDLLNLPPAAQSLLANQLGGGSMVATAQAGLGVIQSVASGKAPSFSEVTSLVATGATLIGGPLAGAAVAAAGPILQAVGGMAVKVLTALKLNFWAGTPPSSITAQTAGQALGVIPSGPDDVATWLTFTPANGDFSKLDFNTNPKGTDGNPVLRTSAASVDLVAGVDLAAPCYQPAAGANGGQAIIGGNVDNAFSWAYSKGQWDTTDTPKLNGGYFGALQGLIVAETTGSVLQQFYQCVATALLRNFVVFLNGHPCQHLRDVLLHVAQVWNLTHARSVTKTFQAPASPTGQDSFYIYTDPINALLGGFLDETGSASNAPPLVVNTGPSLLVNRVMPIASSASASTVGAPMSTGTKMLIGTGIAAAAATGGWFALGQPMTTKALELAFKGIGGGDRR